MATRAIRTPLTMAVLTLLRERPRHPYDMQAILRDRYVGEVVKLRGGSLYDAIRRLEAAGLLAAVETNRAGARPERTVYAITDAGEELLDALVEEYLGTVAEEYPVFSAGLAHILNVQPAKAIELLSQRIDALQARFDEVAKALTTLRRDGLPRVVTVEAEYAQTMRKAEIRWLRTAVHDIETGDLPWL